MKHCLLLVMAAIAAFGQGQIEPRAGTWRTWILSSGRELRLPPPGDGAATADEISWLKDFMAGADNAARRQVAFWDTGSPGMRWLELVEERILDGRIALPMAIR